MTDIKNFQQPDWVSTDCQANYLFLPENQAPKLFSGSTHYLVQVTPESTAPIPWLDNDSSGQP